MEAGLFREVNEEVKVEKGMEGVVTLTTNGNLYRIFER